MTTDTCRRISLDADNAARGLGQLVVAVLELVRDLLERQAIRRVDAGSLTPEEIERLGQALIALDERFELLREIFAADGGDLRVGLGELLDEELKKFSRHPGGPTA
jgi:hypothetical protein